MNDTERELIEAKREIARLRERVAFLAYALAEVSASPVYRVTDDQFSILATEAIQ